MTDRNLPTGFLGKRVQIAYVVRDLDAAMTYWTDVMKIGPFVVIENARGDRAALFCGRETDLDFTLAFSYLGDVQIELIQQTNDALSAYKEFLDGGREGFHHTAFWPDDMQAAIVMLGQQPSQFRRILRGLQGSGE